MKAMYDGVYEPKLDDLAEIYQPASWLAKTDLINQSVFKSNIMISVLAEQSGGKTVFSQMLRAKLNRSIKICFISADRLFVRDDFLKELGTYLDAGADFTIKDIITSCNAEQKHLMVMIDDAQWLSENVLVELLDGLKSQGKEGYFHLCLFSDFSMVKTTAKFADKNYKDLIHSVELGALSESETREFVLQRLPQTPETELRITDERMKRFYELTEGSIVGINTQLIGFFGNSSASLLKHKNTFLPYAGIMGLAVIATSIAYTLHSNKHVPHTKAPVTTVQAEGVLVPAPKNITPPRQEKPVEMFFTSNIPTYLTAARHQSMHVASMKRAEVIVVQEEVDDEAMSDSLVVMDSVIPVPKIIVSPPKPKPKIKSSVQTPAPKKSAMNKNIKSSDKYTVQLIASRDLNELKHFIKQHNLKNQVKIRITENQGKDWYVLTMGEYTDSITAKKAALQMPKSLNHYKPWVRPIANLRSWG